jgi:hypothetical protein
LLVLVLVLLLLLLLVQGSGRAGLAAAAAGASCGGRSGRGAGVRVHGQRLQRLLGVRLSQVNQVGMGQSLGAGQTLDRVHDQGGPVGQGDTGRILSRFLNGVDDVMLHLSLSNPITALSQSWSNTG